MNRKSGFLRVLSKAERQKTTQSSRSKISLQAVCDAQVSLRSTGQNRCAQVLVRASGATVTILLSASDTKGAISVIETVFPPGDGVPFHMHSREDETFYVVSGTGEFRLGGTTVVRGAGSRVYGPRDVPHTFRNVGDDDLKCLIVYSPGGFEQCFIEIAALREGADLASTGAFWPSMDYRVREVARAAAQPPDDVMGRSGGSRLAHDDSRNLQTLALGRKE